MIRKVSHVGEKTHLVLIDKSLNCGYMMLQQTGSQLAQLGLSLKQPVFFLLNKHARYNVWVVDCMTFAQIPSLKT